MSGLEDSEGVIDALEGLRSIMSKRNPNWDAEQAKKKKEGGGDAK